MPFSTTIRNTNYRFEDLRTLLAKATPEPPAISWQELPRMDRSNAWLRR
jgi:hypothetical protein